MNLAVGGTWLLCSSISRAHRRHVMWTSSLALPPWLSHSQPERCLPPVPWGFQKKKTLEERLGLGQLPGEVGLPGRLLSACPPTPRGGRVSLGRFRQPPRDLQLQGGRAGRSQANIPGLAGSLGGPCKSSPSQRDLLCVELGPAACHLCDPWAVKKKMFITVLKVPFQCGP